MAKGQIKQKQALINKSIFEELCRIQCTRDEIAAVFGVSYATLERWCQNTYNEEFVTIFSQKRCDGKSSLRRVQWRMAENNPTMAIWLGKQYLGQTDKQENVNMEKVTIVNDINSEVSR